jgi:hypothetical protein
MEKMPEIIGGFSQLEYLTVFNAIIFGVIATEYFGGWGSMLRFRTSMKFYPLHFLWTFFSFFTLIQNWFGSWPRVEYVNNNILYFFYSLVPMFVFYLLTVLLFPNSTSTEKIDFKEFYFKNSRVFFVIYTMYFAVTILGSFIYDDKGEVLQQNIVRCGGLLFSLVCAYYDKKVLLHYFFLTVGFVGLIQFLIVISRFQV